MKKIISVMLAAAMLLSACMCASAYETDDTAKRSDTAYESFEDFGNYEYEFNDTGVTITAYHGSETDLNVPSYINGKWVTEIDMFVFQNNTNIRSVVLPSSVVKIGDMCFWGCSSLESITLPEKLTTLGSSVFRYCVSLERVNLPKNFYMIGTSVFDGCSSLKEITVDSENPYYMTDNGVLFDKKQNTLICYPAAKTDTNYVMPNTVKAIDDYAFSGAGSLYLIGMSSGIESIGMYAFNKCTNLSVIPLPGTLRILEFGAFMGCDSLTECDLPDSIEYIGMCVFDGCRSLEKISVNTLRYTSKDGVLFECNSTTYQPEVLMAYPAAKADESYTVPKGVKKIDDYAFVYSQNLKVLFPGDVEEVGHFAFAYGESLVSVNLGSHLQQLGFAVTMGCKNLEFITVEESPAYSSDESMGLFNKYKSILLEVPNKARGILDGKYFVPEGVRHIGPYCFAECDNIEEVVFSIYTYDYVESIESMAFYNCTSLKRITIPKTVTSIEMFTFVGCSSLEEITIPASVTNISEYNFDCNENMVIKGYAGSEAERFAERQGFTFINIGETIDPIIGDVDGDGKITAKDSMKAQRFVIGLAKLDDQKQALADVNNDGKVDNRDALEILRYTIGLSKNDRIGKLFE